MKCKHCGTENREEAVFCSGCGNKLESDSGKNGSGKKKWLFMGCAAVLILIAGISAFLVSSSAAKKEQTYQTLLELGDKYLEELSYEQAILSYEQAITIKPRESATYIRLADVYLDQEDYETAYDVLDKGYEVTGDTELQVRKEEAQKQREGETETESQTEPEPETETEPETEKSFVWEEMSEQEIKELEKVVSRVYKDDFTYEEDEVLYEFIISVDGYMFREIYQEHFGEEGVEINSGEGLDPLEKFDYDYYAEIEGENADWVLQHIFHIEPTHTIHSGAYYHEGKYYVVWGDKGWRYDLPEIVEFEHIKENDYYAIVDYTEEFEHTYRGRRGITLRREEVNGKKIWTYVNIEVLEDLEGMQPEVHALSEGQTLTVTGFFEVVSYGVAEFDMKTPVVNLTEPIICTFYDGGPEQTITSIQVAFDDYAVYMDQEITLTGEVMFEMTSHHIRPIILLNCSIQ